MMYRLLLLTAIITFTLTACVCNSSSSTFIEKWRKSAKQNDSTFLLLDKSIHTDTVTVTNYKIPYSILSPTNNPYRTTGIMYLENQICIGIDVTTGIKFTLFDFKMKPQDTILQKSPWLVYPDSFKITLDKIEYVKNWNDTIYKFRYINMDWKYKNKKKFREDWVWCISKGKGVYGIYLECVNSDEIFYSGKNGKFPTHWGKINILDYCIE